jgi:hypothetical protein
VSPSHRLSERLCHPAVEVGDLSLDVADLILLGLLDGSWSTFENLTAVGMALASDPALDVPQEESHAAATAFRLRHRLISANDFLTWLGERSLTVDDIAGFLDRRLRRERVSGEQLPSLSDSAVRPGEAIGDVIWPEAIGSGMLDSLATQAADLLIAGDAYRDVVPAVSECMPADEAIPASDALSGLSAAEVAVRVERLVTYRAALGQMRTDAAQPTDLRRCVAAHSLDWLSVSGTELELTTEGAAREARLLIAEDGLEPTAVAALSGVRAAAPPRQRELLIAEAPLAISGMLAAAAPGEVVGPWPVEDRWRLLLVQAKQPPSLELPALRALALEERLRIALDRHGAGRVRRLLAL